MVSLSDEARRIARRPVVVRRNRNVPLPGAPKTRLAEAIRTLPRFVGAEIRCVSVPGPVTVSDSTARSSAPNPARLSVRTSVVVIARSAVVVVGGVSCGVMVAAGDAWLTVCTAAAGSSTVCMSVWEVLELVSSSPLYTARILEVIAFGGA